MGTGAFPLVRCESLSIFVGRERELGELRSGLDEATNGHGRLSLVSGEPGIGKTHLIAELALEAERRGILVLRGWGWEGGGAPQFWPWVQVIRAYAASRDIEPLRCELGDGAAYLAQIVPALRDRLGAGVDSPSASSVESGNARFVLFDSTARFFQLATRSEPLVLTFDDLHAADDSSLLLLRFLARELRDSPLFVVGAYRDVDVERDAAIRGPIADLSREGRRISLGGLAETEVARLVERAAGTAPAESLVRAIHQRTEGNPLFVDEIVRALGAAGQLDRRDAAAAVSRIPERVRDAIRRRMSPLPQRCHDVLSVASVIGREFTTAVLEAVSGRPRDQVLEILDEAAAAAIVTEGSGARGRYAFSHALFRETLYEDVPTPRRLGLHRQIGETIEQLYGANLEPHATALAHHFFEAATTGNSEKAVEYCKRAGRGAAAQFAYEEAIGHYERALQALDFGETPNGEEKCELFLELGAAQGRAGEASKARETFLRAADIARRAANPALLARAALGAGGGFEAPSFGDLLRTDDVLVALLEESLTLLGTRDISLRARLLGRLAVTVFWSDSAARADALTREAVELAEKTADPELLARELSNRRLVLSSPENLEERHGSALRGLELAKQARDPELELEAHRWLLKDFLERGDIRAADREIEAHRRLAEKLRQPLYRAYSAAFGAMRALMRGEFARADELAGEAWSLGERGGAGLAIELFDAQLFNVALVQGRTAVMEAISEAVRGRGEPTARVTRAGLASLFAAVGKIEEARAGFEEFAAQDFRTVPRDVVWLITLTHLSQTCAVLRDARRAALLHDLLLPYSAQNVAPGPPPMYYWGPVAHHLGVLAAIAGRFEEGDRHFRAALEMSVRMESPPFAADTEYEYARMLIARGRPGDRERAAELLERALATAERLGMKPLEEKILELRSARALPAPAIVRSEATFRKEGDFWKISRGGEISRLTDLRGFHYLVHLLHHPGTEFHVIDLMVTVERPEGAEPRPTLGDAGVILDRKAKDAYRQRLADLKEELSEAERTNDAGRAARAEHEIDCLTEELARAVGLGGRDRRAASDVGRERLRITKAIKYAVTKIEEASPALGDHLRRTVKTGFFCSYDPDPRSPISWNL